MKILCWLMFLVMAAITPGMAKAGCDVNVTFTQANDCTDVDHWVLEYDGVSAPDIMVACADPMVVTVPVSKTGKTTFHMKAVALLCVGGTEEDKVCHDDTDCAGGTCTGSIESVWSNEIDLVVKPFAPGMSGIGCP